MADYGFSINVSGNSIAQMKQIEAELQKLGVQAKTTGENVNNSFNQMGENAIRLGTIFAEAFAVREIIHFGRELMNTAAEFEGFENVIKYSSTGIVDAGNNLDYVRTAIERLHLPMKETYESFSEMQAGFYGTGIEGEKLRKVFEGVATASSVLHLNPEQFSRTTFALKEIGELGTLQARQLRMLAFALPGAGNIAAQSMGMTSEELHEAMKKGEVQSSEFLPKFAEALSKTFSAGLPNAGNSLISQINDAKNEVIKLTLDMGESLKPLWLDILHTIGDGMRQLKAIWDSLSGNTAFVNSLKFIFEWVVKLLPILIAYKAVVLGVNAVTAVLAIENGILTATMGSLTVMTDGATVAFEGFATALATTGIGALIIGLGLAIEKIIGMNSELDKTIDKKYKLSETKGTFETSASEYSRIKEQLSIVNQLQPEQKQKLVADIQQYLAQGRQQIPILNKRATDLQSGLSGAGNELGGAVTKFNRQGGYGGDYTALYKADKNYQKTAEQLKEVSGNMKTFGSNFAELKNALSGPLAGIKPFKSSFPNGTGTTDGSIATSALSGAQGGLGQAKVINIHINKIQEIDKVEVGPDWKAKSQDAIEVLIRTLNNINYSQSATM